MEKNTQQDAWYAWLDRHRANDYAYGQLADWAATAGPAPADIIAECPRADWLFWLARRVGYSREDLAGAARPLIISRLHDWGFVDLASDATPGQIRSILRPHRKPKRSWGWWADRAACRLTWGDIVDTMYCLTAAYHPADPGGSKWETDHAFNVQAGESARLADEIRAAIPDLSARLAAAIVA